MSDLRTAPSHDSLDQDEHNNHVVERPAYAGIFERYEHEDSHHEHVDTPTSRWPAVGAVLGVIAAATTFLIAVFIGVGLLITHFFVHSRLGRADERVSIWFSHHRTGFSKSLSLDLTKMADAPVIVGIVVLVTAILLFRKWGRFSAFLAMGIVMEVVVFEVSEHVVARPRPSVVHLGVTPPTFSWPSGHTAAALVTYMGIALLVSCATRRTFPRVLAWTLAIALTLGVAWSRVFEGEHHLSDVIGGLILGSAVLYSAVLAMRAWSRHSPRHPSFETRHSYAHTTTSEPPRPVSASSGSQSVTADAGGNDE